MLIEDLERRYGPYAAEMIRLAMTLEDFETHEVEELIPYFELKAERAYEEYRQRQNGTLPPGHPIVSTVDYLSILKRRWQQAEEMAHFVLEAERRASEREMRAMEA